MARHVWSIKRTLVFAFGGLICLLCALAGAQYVFQRAVQGDNVKTHLVYGAMSAHSLNLKDAMVLAHDRLLDYFTSHNENDWDMCRIALHTVSDEMDNLAALLGDADTDSTVSRLADSVRRNYELFMTLSQEGKAQTFLSASVQKRFFDFITRPGLHSLRSLDALLEAYLHRNNADASPIIIENYGELHAINRSIARLRSDAVRSIIAHDIRLMENNQLIFEDIQEAIAALQGTQEQMHSLEALRVELNQYRELHTQFYTEWNRLIQVEQESDATGQILMGEATELIEEIALSRDAAIRKLDVRHQRMQYILLCLYMAALLLAIRTGLMLHRRLVQPLDALSSFAESSAYGLPPVPISGVAEVNKAVQRIADMVAVRNRQLGKALADNRKAQEAALAARNDAAAKTAFMARMSHELRTPMNSILGMGYLFGKTALTTKQQNYLTNITASAKNIITILDDILNFLRLESDTVSLEFRAFSLQDFMAALREAYAAPAREKGLAFTVTIEENLPSVLWGDANRIGQVLHNFVDNALKFIHQGSIDVRVEQADMNMADSAWMAVHFSVQDSGTGLSQELLDQVNRNAGNDEDIEIPRKFGESGLGLALCRRLVHLMRGTFWVESEPGAGSVFHCTIPCGLDGSEGLSGIRQSFTFGGAEPGPETTELSVEPDLEGFTVLLVEDNELNQEICTELLTNCGLDVTTVQDGLGAITLIEQRPFDLVFMDIQMPGISGFETVRRIRALKMPWAATIPIIAMTAHVLESDKERSREVGMQGHIDKPINPNALYGVLRAWLKKGSTHSDFSTHLEAPMSTLDVSLGLHHLNGNEQLYNKLLRRFADSNANVAQDIRSAVDGGDMETAIRVAHTLKGVAASLGAPSLSDVALEIEQSLKGGSLPDDGLEKLEAELAKVFAAIEERLG